MSLKTLVIHQNKILHNILEEISENINYKIIFSDTIDQKFNDLENFIIITKNENIENNYQLSFNNFPLKLEKFLEIINVAFLKQEYNLQSNIKIGKYDLNLNSRMLSFNENNLELTEMEANVIFFLKKSKKPISVKKLQLEVWKQLPNLETHTVETHIYRLRKKIKEKFQDEDFIKSLKDGYQII